MPEDREPRWCRRRFLSAVAGSSLAIGWKPRHAHAEDSVDQQLALPDGRLLGFRIYGPDDGFPVLYFHGTPGSRLEVLPLEPICHASGVRLVAVDRPGMGLSTYSCAHTVARWPCDVALLTDHLREETGFSRLGLLATSGGTAFALACAEQLYDRISATAIISPRTPFAPGVPLTETDRDLARLQRHPRLGTRVIERAVRKCRRQPERFRLRQFDAFAPVDQHFIAQNAAWLRRSFLEAARCGVAGIVHEMRSMRWPCGLCLESIQVPVALWQGLCDYSAPEATSLFLQDRIPDCSATFVEGEGHFTIFTNFTAEAFEWLMNDKET